MRSAARNWWIDRHTGVASFRPTVREGRKRKLDIFWVYRMGTIQSNTIDSIPLVFPWSTVRYGIYMESQSTLLTQFSPPRRLLLYFFGRTHPLGRMIFSRHCPMYVFHNARHLERVIGFHRGAAIGCQNIEQGYFTCCCFGGSSSSHRISWCCHHRHRLSIGTPTTHTT